jgi:amino acid transporter
LPAGGRWRDTPAPGPTSQSHARPAVRVAAAAESGLDRSIGIRSLTASIVNVTVGAGIFVLPAAVSANIGSAAPAAFLVCAGLMALVVASYALAGSRVAASGGPYAYTEAAFGPFVGYLAGITLWLADVLAAPALAAALAGQMGTLVPALAAPFGRAAFIAGVLALLALVNVRGVAVGVRAVEGVTVAKLAPLAVFIGVGVFFVDLRNLQWPGLPPSAALGDTVLLLVFAFVGIEVALAPSGEVRNPVRTVPASVFLALGVTTFLYMAIQFVAQGVAGTSLAASRDAPLADTAALFLGAWGRTLLLVGASVSMFGYLAGSMLATPRTLFALARDGVLPAAVARVHPRFHTPYIAVGLHAALTAAIGISSSFERLAIVANVVVLSLNLLVCAAAWRLLERPAVPGQPGGFVFPGARLVLAAAMLGLLWVLGHATWQEFAWLGGVLGVATALYFLRPAAASAPPR